MPYKDPQKRIEKAREYTRKWRAAHPEYSERKKLLPSYGSKRMESTLQARRAYWEVQKALKAGTLVRPAVCQECGGHRFCEAAHFDYAQPLNVRWLCRPCHRLADSANPNAGKEPIEVSRQRVDAAERARIDAHACRYCGGWIADHPGRRKYCRHECYVAARWGSRDSV